MPREKWLMAAGPDEGMAVHVPVDRGAVDHIDDLVPTFKPPARQR